MVPSKSKGTEDFIKESRVKLVYLQHDCVRVLFVLKQCFFGSADGA